MPSTVESPKVVSREEWLEARTALLAKEKALTRQRDAVSAERRALPWIRVDKEYTFKTEAGPRSLADLFQGRSQLIIYHFMWRREYGEGCVGCSFLSDHVDGPNQHLAQHDVSFVAVARGPLTSLLAFKRRMGWKFEMVSSLGSDFNFDYNVSFTPEQLSKGDVNYNFTTVPASIEELSGISVFYRPDGNDIFHTYSSYARGNEEVLGAYMWLDLTPKGRNENGPNFSLGDWVRHHDKYNMGGHVDATGAYIVPAASESKCCCAKSEA